MSIIEVANLKYKYPDTERLVLNDISFGVGKGEFIGVIGQNGAGKSTLCFALSGVIPHFFKGGYGGSVKIDGMVVDTNMLSTVVQKVGLVFENPFSQMTGAKYTVYEEIAFGLENMGLERQEMRHRIDESLETLNIADFSGRSPFALSGGQMQRVAIASVIAMKPDVLILDEPTSQLDPRGSADVFEALEKLTEQGITIIMVEHNMERMATFADRVLLLHEGKCVDFNTPEIVFSRDDLLQYGIVPPTVTSVARRLNIKNKGTGLYPLRVKDLSSGNVVKADD